MNTQTQIAQELKEELKECYKLWGDINEDSEKYFIHIESKISQAKDDWTNELYFLTHLFQNKESPDGDVVAMGLMISAVSPFAKYCNSRIEDLTNALKILEEV